MRARANGFTLIEVLIAVTIFAVMSAFAYRALSSILTARERVAEENQKWRSIATFFARLEMDLTNATARDIRNSNNLIENAFVGSQTFAKETEGQLMFTRMGLPGASGTLAAPQRIGYRIKNGTVEELIWPVLDQAPRTVPSVYTVLNGVSTLKLRYLSQSNSWQESWPPPSIGQSTAAKIPRAVSVELNLESGEAITRVLMLPS